MYYSWVRRPEIDEITLANHSRWRQANEPIRSRNTWTWHQARESACEEVAIGFGLILDWLKTEWRGSVEPIITKTITKLCSIFNFLKNWNSLSKLAVSSVILLDVQERWNDRSSEIRNNLSKRATAGQRARGIFTYLNQQETWFVIVGSFSNDDRDGNENFEKARGLD